MDGPHPSDIELLEYVEGELADEEAASLRRHLETCEICALEIAAVERSRAVLRASPVLDLGEQRLRAMVADLPPHDVPVAEQRRFLRSRARLLAVITPAAAAAIAVVAFVLVTRDGGNGGQPQLEAIAAQTSQPADAAPEATAPSIAQAPAGTAPAGGAPAETAPAESAEAPAEAGDNATLEQARAPAAQVQGPAREVVRVLERAGLDARAVEGTVEVRGASVRQIERALRDRAPGTVDVYLAGQP